MRETEARTRYFVVLGIIYLGFISLGLPDTILGVAWPGMRISLDLPVSYAGALVSVTTICSVGSSIASGYAAKRWGTPLILAASGFLTGSALLGYAYSTLWAATVLLTIPLGFGQGAVDTTLNAYVAKHYSSRHMNWLHCCWGAGATGGPLIVSALLGAGFSWRAGYLAIAALQLALASFFLTTAHLWGGRGDAAHAGATAEYRAESETEEAPRRRRTAAAAGCLFYFLYPGLEVTAGLWGVSFLVEIHGAAIGAAGLAISLYWGSLTVGRFCVGLVSHHFADRTVIRAGIGFAAAGALGLATAPSAMIAIGAFLLLGLGLAPLYPTMMHDTPHRVGGAYADRAIGLQIGANFAGVSIVPPLAGIVASRTSLHSLGPILLLFAALVAAAHEISAASAPSSRG